ncbi:protein AKNAD1 isoform X2 [Kryptolebias marmoratus]|uniref:protein AKNAD1 isoform X2 n=1 Tax=Kryptolebias marmoratus TaxID=37003 RepID=UPI0007F8968A|nr:protein AKNAD1 isoform X2 [Kryptolebias marmoratus]
MEGDSEESSDDVPGEDKPVVLWEKCIQQSIFVELSEDESLHLSDLESSLALHLSQAESAASEASIHLSELSVLDDTSSESCSVSSKNAVESKAKSSAMYVSAQRPNTMQDEPPVKQETEDPGQNTSDEDQEDLPYDGDLESSYFNHTASSVENSEGGHTAKGTPDPPCLPELLQKDTKTKCDDSYEASKPTEGAPPCPVPADFTHLLLRHFSEEELLQSGRLIEAETLPEVSLLESVDDTVFSLAPALKSSAVQSSKSKSFNERCKTASENGSLEVKTERGINDFTPAGPEKSASSSGGSNQSSGDVSADVANQENAEESDHVQRAPLVRARSFSEMKYGQGQVHYPLPDFSKVAPKVKIPKTPSGPVRPGPQCPYPVHRAQSSPGMLEVISRVLEDSIQPPEKPYVFKDSDKPTQPALVHHLQAEYDKLLTKYAEAENLIDQMRLGANPSSEGMLSLERNDDDKQVEFGEESPVRNLVSHLPSSENLIQKEAETTHSTPVKEANTVSSNQPEARLSDGERMTAELADVVTHFMQKVEDLRCNVSNVTVSTAEQQMMLRSMMEAQDQLERKYISKKEEHRALEMQNYMGLSRNTGAFDPDRLVEGDIFRIGMHLEDIKEMIDKNTYEQISPPQSSSTPTSTTLSLHAKPGPLSFDTPSPPPSLHEGSSAGFSSPRCETDVQKEEDKEEEKEEASEVFGNEGLNQSSALINTDPADDGRNISLYRDSLGSSEGQRWKTAEDEEGHEEERSSVWSEGRDQSHVLAANLRGETRSASEQKHQAADNPLNSNLDCDLGECVSLGVEVSCSSHLPRDSDIHSNPEPPVNTSCVSQRIVSPETDSGFGSSYLNQSASGAFQPHLLSESVLSQSDGLNGSDSEGSCSNLNTTIHSALPSVRTRLCGAAAVDLWVESTTKEPSIRPKGSEQKLPVQLQHHLSEPVLSTSMDTVDRSSPLNSCSCNSEAILALQTEVSRLKKDLEEGLVQLPHLAQRMDHLSSKYREERQERRSKTSAHQISSSVVKSISRGGNNLTSSQLKIQDWISSDMDPSKSKGTDSARGSCSEIMLEERDSPGGSLRSLAGLGEKFQHKTPSNRGTVRSFTLKEEHDWTGERHVNQRPQAIKSFYSKDRWSLLSTPSLQKPLLQVNYGSSCSLPASYKVWEPPLQSVSWQRKASTQSDSALLPSNVLFQRTPSPVSPPPRTISKTNRRRGKKEEDMSRTLDQAIDVARCMKRTTDRMARRLSADLAKAQLHRKLYNMQPHGGRKHQTF